MNLNEISTAISTTISLQVRYGETDQMGIVYHGNYPSYLEVARIQFFNHIGISYKSLEENGIMLPVTELNIKYLKPAHFDEELSIHVSLREIPKGPRIIFDYEIFNKNGNLLTIASTNLAFINKENRRPIRCPESIIERLNSLKNQS